MGAAAHRRDRADHVQLRPPAGAVRRRLGRLVRGRLGADDFGDRLLREGRDLAEGLRVDRHDGRREVRRHRHPHQDLADSASSRRRGGRGLSMADEPDHQDLCDREAAFVARAIARISTSPDTFRTPSPRSASASRRTRASVRVSPSDYEPGWPPAPPMCYAERVAQRRMREGLEARGSGGRRRNAGRAGTCCPARADRRQGQHRAEANPRGIARRAGAVGQGGGGAGLSRHHQGTIRRRRSVWRGRPCATATRSGAYAPSAAYYNITSASFDFQIGAPVLLARRSSP